MLLAILLLQVLLLGLGLAVHRQLERQTCRLVELVETLQHLVEALGDGPATGAAFRLSDGVEKP
jgi:hypothetical protein